MDCCLKNEFLEVVVSSFGAEMTRVRSKENIEYIWCGDKKYWGRHAPVLFPIVGKVLDNEYTVEGKSYQLTQHGFARDNEFELLDITKDQITFMLRANDKTKERYPYDFELRITYTLIERTVAIKYEVINHDQEVMPFSIGAHPAFNCPLVEEEAFEDYYFEFEKEEKAERLLATREVYLTGEKEAFNKKEVAIDRELFKDDAIILSNLQSSKIAMRSRKSDHSVVMSCSNFPFLGLWSQVGDAPFVCIEPWIGHTDYINDSKEMAEKKDITLLEPQSVYGAEYKINFK